MTRKKTSIEKLDTALEKILQEYEDTLETDLDTITKKMGQKGAVALRQASKEKFKQRTGAYAKGWKYEYRKTLRYSKTTIFNDHYSLPHLLEYSHVVRNGTKRVVGAYRGRPHIKPIADDLTSTYQKEVIEKL